MNSYKTEPEEFLKDIFKIAVKAAYPEFSKLGSGFPNPPLGRTIVVGAGKAAGSMAQSFERVAKQRWSEQAYSRLTGLVVTRYQHGLDCERIEVIEASHPIPDEAGERAAHQILEAVQNLSVDDLVICLISGGGSALLTIPADGLTLKEKKSINKQLLQSGASISEINCVRKHLSKIKGGRLTKYCHPAKVLTYLISDVPGDDPSVIASGPTLPDMSTCEDALEIIHQYGIEISDQTRCNLEQGAYESPKPTDPEFQNLEPVTVLSTAESALNAVREYALTQGLQAVILSDSIEGEAKDVAKVHGAMASWIREKDSFLRKPCLLISGGETTVTVRGNGRGGRNAEFLLSLLQVIDGKSGIYALAADTDGIDGSENNAGAFFNPETLEDGLSQGLSPKSYLTDNDAYSYFEKLNKLLITGPTRTNVNDFRAILIV